MDSVVRYVVRSRLKRVHKEAVKCNALAREEEVRRFPFRYIKSVKSPNECVLGSNHEMRDAFRTHFRDCFARCPDLPVQEFRSYLADLPCLREAEAASCEGLVTECEVCDALKQASLNKSSGLDGLRYEVYLRLPHVFVPILTDVFNQGTIPGSVTKGVITLPKKGGRHVWEELDDYRPITLLNTELKILVQVLANRLLLVISDLVGPEQNYAVKGILIHHNLHLVLETLEALEDGTKATLINLDQSKVFDKFDHRVLGDCFGYRRIPTGIPQVDKYDVPQPASGGAGKRVALEVFAIERSVRQGCPLSHFLYVLALEPLLHRFRDEKANPAMHGIPFAGPLSAKVFANTDDITVFVSRLCVFCEDGTCEVRADSMGQNQF